MSSDIKHLLTRMDSLQESPRALPALFRPVSISPVLTAPADPRHPTADYQVGSLEETMQSVEEDVLNRVRHDLSHYLDQLSDRYADDGSRPQGSRAQDLIADRLRPDDVIAPRAKSQSGPAKTYTMYDGSMLECWGDEYQGFELRRGQRRLPTRFPSLNDADIAVALYQQRHQRQDPDQDYIEER